MPTLVAAVVAALITGVVVAALLARVQRATARSLTEQLRRAADGSQQAGMSAAVEAVTALAGERLAVHGERVNGQLEARSGAIGEQLAAMNAELVKVSGLVRQLETGRERQYGAVAEALRSTGEQTARLAETTASLRQALSSTSARGQWGERMAEDVLRLAGFLENVNYRKQRAVADGRPDFTFLLPRDMLLHMDVKFPLDNYLRHLDADGDAERERTRVAFLRDVRLRVRELARREYAAGQDCLSCVLLFIPNEQLYAFIQEQDASVSEEALRCGVVLCSPLTLFAVLAVVRQAMDSFALEQTSAEILSELGSFHRQWGKFTEQMDKVGRGIATTSRAYDELMTTRARQLEKPLDKLEEMRRHRGLPVAAVPAGEPPTEGGRSPREGAA